MLSERKLRRPSANVVARLMGLEGLPYQRRAPTRCQDNKMQDNVTTPCRDNFSIKEGDVCKDVFIVHETVKVENVRGRKCVFTASSGSDRSLDGQRYMNEESCATDMKNHLGVKIGDPSFVANMNKEVFVEFLQNPTPLLTKHLRGLESSNVQARCFRNTARKTMRVPLSELIDGRWSSSRQHECLCRAAQSTHSIQQEGFEHSTSWSKSEYEMSTVPARIVVLEPNRNRLNKHHAQYACESGYEAKRTNIGKSPNVDHSRRRSYGHQVEFSVGKGRKSEELRRNLKKKVRGLRTAALGFIPDKSAGYAGDESSFFSSGDELKNVLESQNLAGSSSWSSLSHYGDAACHMKHRNSIPQHCETSSISQTTAGSSKIVSLGNILGEPNKEEKAKTMKSRIDGLGTGRYQFEANGDYMCLVGTDNTKVKYSRDSPKNISLRGQSSVLRLCKSSVHPEIAEVFNSAWTTEAGSGRLCSNPSQADVSENEIVMFRNGKLSRNPHVRRSSNRGKNTIFNSYEADARSSVLHQHPIPAESPAPFEDVPNEDVKTCDLDMLISKEVFIQHNEDVLPPTTKQALGSISPASSKEAEQPSPVSVHDFSNVDVSSFGSDYFGQVSADLQGLRAQVRMLKLEIAEDDDEPDPQTKDDTGKGTVSNSEEKGFGLDDISDSSYLADVLVECGFEDADPTAFLYAWDLLDVPPMKLSVFENVEKKYGEKAAWSRSERRLLFDNINSKLAEILDQYTNPSFWSKPMAKKLLPAGKNDLESELCKFLNGLKQKKSDKNFQQQGVLLLGELELWECIVEIGKEVEETLVDELVAEVFRKSQKSIAPIDTFMTFSVGTSYL